MKLAITVQNHADYRRVEAIGDGVEGSVGNSTPSCFFKVYLIDRSAIVKGALEDTIWADYHEWRKFETHGLGGKLESFALKGGVK